MSLSNYQEHFDNSYEEVFNKTLVSKIVTNMRFQAKLKYGESVERFAYDASAVRVRSVTRGVASTIDTIADSTDLLTINLEEEAVFHISDGEVTQAGPLNPGEVIGAQIGYKVSKDLDHKVLSEVQNAANTFDTGDLTTLTSNATPIVLSSTTVPQMSTRMSAKLRYREQQDTSSNMVLVVDSYAGADIAEFLISKNIDLAGATFANGYAGNVNQSALVICENLLGEYQVNQTSFAVAGDTVVVAGVTFTAAAAPAAAGDFDVEASADDQAATIVAAINNSEALAASAVGTDYAELTAADRNILEDNEIRAEVDAADASNVRIYGSGRLVASNTLTNAAAAKNILHAYYGKRGAIDVVVQDLTKVDMRPTDDRRGTNVFSSYLAGIKTFTDASKKFLDLWIDAS